VIEVSRGARRAPHLAAAGTSSAARAPWHAATRVAPAPPRRRRTHADAERAL